MNIDDFVNKAVSQVRHAKGTGKQARKARKELSKSEQLLAKTKADIRAVAKACEQRAWQPTRLIMMRFERVCKCCGETSSCIDAIYLEKTHKSCGTILTRLDEVQVNSYPALPRVVEHYDQSFCVCVDCFTSYDPMQQELPFEDVLSRFIKPTRPTKWDVEFGVFSETFDKQWRTKAWRSITPSTLLLEHHA